MADDGTSAMLIGKLSSVLYRKKPYKAACTWSKRKSLNIDTSKSSEPDSLFFADLERTTKEVSSEQQVGVGSRTKGDERHVLS